MKKLLAAMMVLCLSLSCVNVFSVEARAKKSIDNKFDDGVKIKLALGDQTYEAISYNISYSIPANKNVPAYNVVNVSIKASKVDQNIWNWLTNPQPTEKDGSITIYDADSGKAIRTITFTGMTPASFNENINTANNYSPAQTSFGFRYKTIGVTTAN